MKKIAFAALAASALAAAPAEALTFKFAFTSVNGDAGNGVLTTTALTGRYYFVTGISGVVNGNKIVGLSDFGQADQKLKINFQPHNGSHFTKYGVSFADDMGELFNFTNYPTFTEDYIIHSGDGDEAPSDMNFSITAVPEPATWGMMIAGFGAIGFATRRRRRTAISFG